MLSNSPKLRQCARRTGRNSGLELLAACSALALALASAASASAKEEAALVEQDEAQIPQPGDTDTASRESFPASYFARFAPRNAFDMLDKVPGFSLDTTPQDPLSSTRGFGQASDNVLVNGERLTSKSTSIADQLRRVPAENVLRIDIVDGASLDLPGLSGQVANVIVSKTSAMSGQFEWKPTHNFLTDFTNYLAGNVSVTGSSGILDYIVSFENVAQRFGAKGPTNIEAENGGLIENRQTLFKFYTDRPTITADLRIEPASDVVANLNLSYYRRISKTREDDTRDFVIGTDAARNRLYDGDTYDYEIAADIAFPLGPGQLKLIALEAFNSRDFSEEAIFSFADGSDSTGRRFKAVSDTGERIARGEYSWPMFSLDWQATAEAAFNRLNRESEFSLLDTAGQFVEVPLPGATGNVVEDRYDFALSAGGAMTGRLDFQLTGGAEFSTIEDLSIGGLRRSFRRPKGSALLAWNPADGWDLSLELARRVGQLDFADFLANVSLGENQQTSANALLVPQQSWELELEVSRNLGAWGNATLRLFENRITDFIDIIPLADGSAARGNIDSARVRGFEITSTIELAPLGFKGARIDFDGTWERSRLTDPLDNRSRPLSSRTPSSIKLAFRHDIPGSDWAWGASRNELPAGRYFRVNEVGREYSGPVTTTVFVENKDLGGLNVRTELTNLGNPKRWLDRTIYAGPRTDNVVDFVERRRQRLGVSFNLIVSGNF